MKRPDSKQQEIEKTREKSEESKVSVKKNLISLAPGEIFDNIS